jgi:hypothetical protein
MTLTGLGSVEGEGMGFVESPAGTRGIDGEPEVEVDDDDDLEGDAGGVLVGSGVGVSGLEVEVEGCGWPSVRNFSRILEASLGERVVVVVVVVLRGLANTVTVTVTGSGSSGLPDFNGGDDVEEVLDDVGFPLLDGEDEDDVEDVLDDVVLVELPGSARRPSEPPEPVTPPLTPEAVNMAITVLSLVQRRDVPGARMSGMAKHCRPSGHSPADVSNFPSTQVAMSPSTQAVSWP